MLTALSTGSRFRLAIAFALFAALCFVAPPAVLAFGHGENTVHCLSKADAVTHGMAISKKVAHLGGHSAPGADHSSPSTDQGMTCCGLFCLSAVAADSGEVIGDGVRDAPVPALETSRIACDLKRIDRPPIPFPFV